MKLKNKVCKNCAHFFPTRLATSMSGNKAGYCLLIQNDTSTDVNNEHGIVAAKSNAIKYSLH